MDKLKPKLQPLPEYGDLFEMDEFARDVANECLIDYDGHGYFATTEGMSTKIIVKPSKFNDKSPPRWATHVVWFNK